MQEGQYKPHEVDAIIVDDFNKIYGKKAKKQKVEKAKSGALSPEEAMKMF
ncbi:hypothetical protein [Staphylococcus caprae]|nr:hypothetical protein [Staphylococcus caprae]MBX5315953.1 hypothetical protein [Staphylococcus caprae]